MRTITLTNPPQKGDHVKSLQRALRTNPWKVNFNPGRLDGVYGPGTAGAVKRAKYWLGYPGKLVTGEAADENFFNFLRGRKKLPAAYRLRRQARIKARRAARPRQIALKLARSKVGVKERPAGSNRVEFTEWYGMVGPWCAMFVTWCYVKSGSKVFQRGKKWAYVPYILTEAKRAGSGLTITAEPAAGDLVIYDWEKNGVSDHIGLFSKWVSKSGGTFEAVEGNTAVGNDSNGGEVMVRERFKSSVAAFIRVHR